MIDNNLPDPKKVGGNGPDTKPGHSGLDALQTVFFVAFMMGCFFLATRPTQVQAALIFRYALIAVGCIGMITVAILKKRQS